MVSYLSLLKRCFAVLLVGCLAAQLVVWFKVGAGKRVAEEERGRWGVSRGDGDGTRWWRLTGKQQQALFQPSVEDVTAPTAASVAVRSSTMKTQSVVASTDAVTNATVMPFSIMLKHFPKNANAGANVLRCIQ